MVDTNYEVTDFRGNTYRVGDTVLYPRMSGRSCELQEGVVVEIRPYEDQRVEKVWNEEEKRWLWTYPTWTNHKVKIQPIRSSRFNRTDKGYNGEPVKPVWIQLGENVVKA